MIKKEHLIAMALSVASFCAYGYGQPASVSVTVEAKITHWTEDPCDYPQYQDKCKMKQEMNIPVIPVRVLVTSTQDQITNYE